MKISCADSGSLLTWTSTTLIDYWKCFLLSVWRREHSQTELLRYSKYFNTFFLCMKSVIPNLFIRHKNILPCILYLDLRLKILSVDWLFSILTKDLSLHDARTIFFISWSSSSQVHWRQDARVFSPEAANTRVILSMFTCWLCSSCDIHVCSDAPD